MTWITIRRRDTVRARANTIRIGVWAATGTALGTVMTMRTIIVTLQAQDSTPGTGKAYPGPA